MSSRKTDRILFELRVVFAHDWRNSNGLTIACSVLPFISHDQQPDECTWRRIFLTSRNLYKCKQAAGIVVVACFNSFFWCSTLLLVVYHVNKLIIFVFAAFVYHFQNTISIFVTILSAANLLLIRTVFSLAVFCQCSARYYIRILLIFKSTSEIPLGTHTIIYRCSWHCFA